MGQAVRTVFVTGGSSGIGLAVARAWARWMAGAAEAGGGIALFARDAGRLEQAVAGLARLAPGVSVRGWPVDLADDLAARAAMEAAMGAQGIPQRMILSAGVTLPGRFERLEIAAQRRVMAVNYFGAVHSLHPVLPWLEAGARIGLIGSAAGIAGIHGYGGYAPSKFALRGLAEVLRVELSARGIGVTLCQPPDTETPMLWAERGHRPAVTERIAGPCALPPEAVADCLMRAMEADRFHALPGLPVRLLHLLGPLAGAALRWRQARLIRALGVD